MKKRTYKGIFVFAVSILFSLVYFSLNNSWAAEKKYPSRPVELVIGYAPGGLADTNARVLAKFLEKYLGVPVVMVYKPGGGAVLYLTYVANASPDGYTIATFQDSLLSALLMGRATFSLEDFCVIAQCNSANDVLGVPIDSQWKTFQEFIDYARRNPGVRMAHPGIGTLSHIRAENLNNVANLKMVFVPLQGDAEVVPAVLGKHIPIGIFGCPAAKAQADAGNLRILFSNDPPAEFGFDPNIPDFLTIFGKRNIQIAQSLMAPMKTPDEIVQVLERAMEKISKDPEWAIELKKIYSRPAYIDGKTVREKILPEKMDQIKKIFQRSGLIK